MFGSETSRSRWSHVAHTLTSSRPETGLFYAENFKGISKIAHRRFLSAHLVSAQTIDLAMVNTIPEANADAMVVTLAHPKVGIPLIPCPEGQPLASLAPNSRAAPP